jgi:UTP--glucose-1-phosphate uridylyltransferase
MPQTIRKAVIPAAGLGTRFLPATKAVPKELLPIVDTPTIQIIVEEAVAAGVTDVILICARGKDSIVDHFDIAGELEGHLERTGKLALRDQMRAIAKMANVVTIRQQEPLGLGHAVLCARDVVGDEPFVVMLGDDIIDASTPATRQLADCYERHGLGTIALMEVPPGETHLYGIAAGAEIAPRTTRIERLVEKPKANPPSNLAVIGRYVLPPAARSSSPTPWRCWPGRWGCSATASRGNATTPATGSATSRPTWPTRSSGPSWPRCSAPGSRGW